MPRITEEQRLWIDLAMVLALAWGLWTAMPQLERPDPSAMQASAGTVAEPQG